MHTKYLSSFILNLSILLFPSLLQSATVKGKLVDNFGGIEYASATLSPGNKVAYTDISGTFSFVGLSVGTYSISFKALGYKTSSTTFTVSNDSEVINLNNITLQESSINLDSVVINTGTATDYNIFDSPVKVEVVNQEYFEEVESYNLVEGIQSVAGVEEVISCGVCGTNDIHINGMEGRYTLVLIDGMPIVSSLASVYGLNGIPTSMIERIEIIKGPASSIYGSEAMGGIINIITLRPENAHKLTLSSSFSSHLESNTSIGFNKQINKKTSALVSANYFTNHYRLDKNNDNFTDFALGDRVSVFGKIDHKIKPDKSLRISGRYFFEDRYGGVMNWEKENRASDSIYGESILTHRAELVAHYDLPIDKKVFLDVSYTYHDQNSYYGDVAYIASEEVMYSTLTWNQGWRKHDFTSGLAIKLNNYNDNTPATATTVKQWIPGVFVQDLYAVNDHLSLLPGVRLDYQNEHGTIFSPRISAKYDLGDWTDLRVSSGKGFKVVNLFTEDHAAISGTRDVVINEKIKPEESYNINFTLDHVMTIGEKGTGKITFDAFYNYFTNQIVPDYDTDPTKIIYDNLDFRSEAKGISTSLNYYYENFSMEGNVTFQRVNEIIKNTEGAITREKQPYTPDFTSNIRLKYDFKKIRSKVVTNVKIVGPQRLPEYDAPFTRPTTSPTFTQVGLRFSRDFGKNLNLGIGVKNLFNYTQDSPLINPQEPYSDTFDTAYAYGPLQTRRVYFSLNYELK